MGDRPARTGALGRRALLQSSTAALALAGLGGGRARAAGTPWADRPGSKVDKLNFVVWTYGDIYTRISKTFADDWGVPVDSTISSFNDHPTKLMTMYAGGDTVDVSQSSPGVLAASGARSPGVWSRMGWPWSCTLTASGSPQRSSWPR